MGCISSKSAVADEAGMVAKDGGKRSADGSAKVKPASSTGGAAGAAGAGASAGGGAELAAEEKAKIESQVASKELAMKIKRQRRFNINAESYEAAAEEPYEKKVVPKTDDARERIRERMVKNFMFANLDPAEYEELIDAMDMERFSKGETVIEQGTEGDKFYVVERGQFDVFVDGALVGHIGEDGNFGELALLYGCPRNATITAVEDAELWALDRVTFRHILVNNTVKEIAENKRFLKKVGLLNGLDDTQITKLAEALQRQSFEPGTTIIKQGEPGNIFYIVKEGQVRVTRREEGKLEELMKLSEGDYFGERALLTAEPRAANVVTIGTVTCMALDRDSFNELLGPLEVLMKEVHEHRVEIAKLHATPMDDGDGESKEDRLAAVINAVLLEDLETISILGEGAFGLVRLVRHKKTGAAFALKCMQKARIVRTNQQRNILNEKAMMLEVKHPFVPQLVSTMKDRDHLYMLLEFLQGGDIFGHLVRRGGIFDVATARFFAATVVLVFQQMHNKNIIYRDLKPENLVLDSDGFCRVVDFGFAKRVPDRTYTLCGTPEYLAPEIVRGKGHNKAVDYWALGVLIYEMLCGFSPFADPENNDQLTIYKNIIRGKVIFPGVLKDPMAKDLIRKLLAGNPSQRFGCLKNGTEDIKRHKWFRDMDWEALLAREVEPPIRPKIRHPLDCSHFDEFPESSEVEPYRSDGTGWDETF
eukprot:PLAT4708.1.p2 GENE.PLAT4708.1~~PLAT4708.1.p2  ORF type:complete len:705 (-),score=394.97 PLAT4708.1:123-2237(-)